MLRGPPLPAQLLCYRRENEGLLGADVFPFHYHNAPKNPYCSCSIPRGPWASWEDGSAEILQQLKEEKDVPPQFSQHTRPPCTHNRALNWLGHEKEKGAIHRHWLLILLFASRGRVLEVRPGKQGSRGACSPLLSGGTGAHGGTWERWERSTSYLFDQVSEATLTLQPGPSRRGFWDLHLGRGPWPVLAFSPVPRSLSQVAFPPSASFSLSAKGGATPQARASKGSMVAAQGFNEPKRYTSPKGALKMGKLKHSP